MAIKFDKPVNVKDLLDGEGFTFTVNFDDAPSNDEDDYYNPSLTTSTEGLDQLKLCDEDTYDFSQEAFEEIAKKMENLDADGYVKKRILRPGKGDVIPANSKVKFDYKMYHEFEPQAFDSTYQRRKAYLCKLGQGELILGLDLALSSMKPGEKSQFLISYQMGYGELGCQPTILPKETLLAEVHLHNYLEVLGEAEPEDPTEFESNYSYALKLCSKANYLVRNEKKYRAAILSYNEAINRMGEVMCLSEEHSEKWADLMMRLYSNAAVSYMNIERYGKVCTNCNRAYQTARAHDVEVPAKIYYNHAKALFYLNDLERADEKLKSAASASAFTKPDKSVMLLYTKIQDALAKSRQTEKKLAQAMFQCKDDTQENTKEKEMIKSKSTKSDIPKDAETLEITSEFKEIVSELCADIINGRVSGQVQLPAKLNQYETEWVKQYAVNNRLEFIQDANDNCFIKKKV